MAIASLEAGIAFSNANFRAVHALAHPWEVSIGDPEKRQIGGKPVSDPGETWLS